VGLLRPDDADDQLHVTLRSFPGEARERTGTAPAAACRSDDELALHVADGKAPGDEREHDEEGEAPDVLPADEAEHRVPDELDAVVQRVEVAEDLRPPREL